MSKRAAYGAKPEKQAIQGFIDALRDVLDMEPLYAKHTNRTEAERFYRTCPDVRLGKR